MDRPESTHRDLEPMFCLSFVHEMIGKTNNIFQLCKLADVAASRRNLMSDMYIFFVLSCGVSVYTVYIYIHIYTHTHTRYTHDMHKFQLVVAASPDSREFSEVAPSPTERMK